MSFSALCFFPGSLTASRFRFDCVGEVGATEEAEGLGSDVFFGKAEVGQDLAPGPEAPKRSSPTLRPARPVYFCQPVVTPASTERRGVLSLPRIDVL